CELSRANGYNQIMRYLVTARVKPGRRAALEQAIDDCTLGEGSIAGDEYLRNMGEARQLDDGRVQWVEVCYCPTPLAEERAYWEEFFMLEKVQEADARVLRAFFRREKVAGRAGGGPLPRRERRRAVGVRAVRLLRTPRSAPRD